MKQLFLSIVAAVVLSCLALQVAIIIEAIATA